MAKKAKSKDRPKVFFRDAHGKFVSAKDRHEAFSVEGMRGGQWQTFLYGKDWDEVDLANALRVDEYKTLPELSLPIGDISSRKKKYRLWDIAQKIDKMKGVRRKPIRLEIQVKDGDRIRTVNAYTTIRSNKERSYQVFKAMRDRIIGQKMYEYDRIPQGMIADMRGRKVKIHKVTVHKLMDDVKTSKKRKGKKKLWKAGDVLK